MTPNQPSESPKRNVYDQWVFDTFGVDPSTYPPVRAAADAPPVSPDAAAIAQGMAIAREAGPGQGVRVAQLAVPGLPLPLPIPPDALPAPLSPAVEREVAHAFGRAGRRLGHIAGEIAHGDLADAAGQAFLGRPFPPQVDDPGLAPPARPARPVPPNPGTTPLGDEQRRAMGRPEGFSGDAKAGQPDVEGFSGTPALPIVLAGPRVDGGAAGPMVVASQSDPGLTRPSGPINGRPGGSGPLQSRAHNPKTNSRWIRKIEWPMR